MSKNSKTKKITEAYDEMEFLEQESKKVQLERKILEEKEKKLLNNLWVKKKIVILKNPRKGIFYYSSATSLH